MLLLPHGQSAWEMPTLTQLEELVSDCTWTWGTYDGTSVKGFLVTGSNGNSIFLPAAGYITVSSETMTTSYAGTTEYYWSSTPNTSDTDNAYFLPLVSTKNLLAKNRTRKVRSMS